MKKLLFATALLAALLLSACGGKTNDDDFMNKPAVTPEPGMEIDPEFGVDPEPETDENAQPAVTSTVLNTMRLSPSRLAWYTFQNSSTCT